MATNSTCMVEDLLYQAPSPYVRGVGGGVGEGCLTLCAPPEACHPIPSTICTKVSSYNALGSVISCSRVKQFSADTDTTQPSAIFDVATPPPPPGARSSSDLWWVGQEAGILSLTPATSSSCCCSSCRSSSCSSSSSSGVLLEYPIPVTSCQPQT